MLQAAAKRAEANKAAEAARKRKEDAETQKEAERKRPRAGPGAEGESQRLVCAVPPGNDGRRLRTDAAHAAPHAMVLNSKHVQALAILGPL